MPTPTQTPAGGHDIQPTYKKDLELDRFSKYTYTY